MLLSGVTGTTTVYLAPTASGGTPRTDHVYTVDGSVPDEYTPQEVAIFVRQEPGAGTVPLHRYLNATTESNYYAVSGTPPAGYSLVGTLGHLETSAGEGRVQLYRHYNQTSGDYLLSTSEAPPGGYVSQGTLGYVYTEGSAPAAQPPVLYVYDLGENGNGRRTSMTDGAGTVTYAYDVLGRVTAVTRPVGGWDYTTRTTYTALGQVETVTYPTGDLVEDGEVVTYAYEAGQVTQVEGRLGATTTTYAKDIAYNAAGQLTSLKYGNDAVRTHTYDAATLRLTALQTTRGTTVLQHFTYDEYDDVGNLRTMKDKKDPTPGRP